MEQQPTSTATVRPPDSTPQAAPKPPAFGTTQVRLSGRQWLVAAATLVMTVSVTPRVWETVERFDIGPDYRLPYVLSKDYWLYERRLQRINDPDAVVLLGDSVVWGEYVLPDGTLSHFLSRRLGRAGSFVNGGVNGLFPLALEGLVRYFGRPLHHRKILLQCNMLWLTSPQADLSTRKEEPFNHSRLVPQFFPSIPCYRANANERLSAVFEREVPFLAWVNHLQCAYFNQRSILDWTLADDGGDPPHYPNCYRSPLSQITFRVPVAPNPDPERGPASPRHKSWLANGAHPAEFDWVPLDRSLQWRAFQRLTNLLRSRGNDVLVVLGPFNEHMVAEDNLPTYRRIHQGILAWLQQNRIPHVAPEPLPSPLYADASHPLTQGYDLLAQRLFDDRGFRNWLSTPSSTH